MHKFFFHNTPGTAYASYIYSIMNVLLVTLALLNILITDIGSFLQCRCASDQTDDPITNTCVTPDYCWFVFIYVDGTTDGSTSINHSGAESTYVN